MTLCPHHQCHVAPAHLPVTPIHFTACIVRQADTLDIPYQANDLCVVSAVANIHASAQDVSSELENSAECLVHDQHGNAIGPIKSVEITALEQRDLHRR